MKKNLFCVVVIFYVLFFGFSTRTASANSLTNLFSDSFTDVDGITLTAHDATWIVGGGIDPTIQANSLYVQGLIPSTFNLGNFTRTIDQCASFDLLFPFINALIHLGVRKGVDNTGNPVGYATYIIDSDHDFAIFWFGGGVYNQYLVRYTLSPFPGDGWHNFKLCAIGTSITAYLDDIVLGTIDDSHVLSPGFPEVQINRSDAYIDNFSYDAIVTITPTLAPTVTPTATPSPTVTPTPTATPTTKPTKKVVVVPGIEASWNQDALVNCKLDNYSGDWTMGEVAAAIYYPLLWNLEHAGWDVRVYNYDWRRQFVDHVSGLNNFIDGLVTGNERVDVIGHSMGGLLGRAYLEEKKEDSGVEILITAGSPHKGTPLAYPTWSAGELWKDNLLDWFYVTLLQRRCQQINGWSEREAIGRAFPAIQNLLPITDYLIDRKTKNILPVGNMSARNNWLPTGFSHPFYGVRVGTLSGKGKWTLEMIKVKEANKNDKKAGDWIDGKPTKRINSKLGDGAVLNSSSMLAGADNRSVNKDHLGLVSSQKGVAEILDLLGAPNAVPAFADWNPPDSMLFVVTDSGSPSVISPNGKETKGKKGLANLENPPKGRYKFKAGPETKWMGVGKFRKDGRMSWKGYDYFYKRPRLEEMEFLD